jgi:hypothetical protein
MYIRPTFIVQQTLPSRIHPPGSVCIRHLGELSLTLAFCSVLINSMLFVIGMFKPYFSPLSVKKSQSRTKMWLNLEHCNKNANDIHEGNWEGLGGQFEAGETREECEIGEVQVEGKFFSVKFECEGDKICGYDVVFIPKHLYCLFLKSSMA